jgi:hypothetical protein
VQSEHDELIRRLIKEASAKYGVSEQVLQKILDLTWRKYYSLMKKDPTSKYRDIIKEAVAKT